MIILDVAIVIFIGVEGALIYSLVKFRARKGAVAAQIHGNTRLEIGWTVGAALILVVLAVVTFVELADIQNPPELRRRRAAARRRGMLLRLEPTKQLPPERQVAEHRASTASSTSGATPTPATRTHR